MADTTSKVKVIEIKQSVFASNDEQAHNLRGELKEKGCSF